jgi:hypothetical protein
VGKTTDLSRLNSYVFSSKPSVLVSVTSSSSSEESSSDSEFFSFFVLYSISSHIHPEKTDLINSTKIIIC